MDSDDCGRKHSWQPVVIGHRDREVEGQVVVCCIRAGARHCAGEHLCRLDQAVVDCGERHALLGLPVSGGKRQNRRRDCDVIHAGRPDGDGHIRSWRGVEGNQQRVAGPAFGDGCRPAALNHDKTGH